MRYRARLRRGGWSVTTLTINGTEKTVRRFSTQEEAEQWADDRNYNEQELANERQAESQTY